MKKMKFFSGIAVTVALLTALGLITSSGIVKSASADYYGGCQVCAWNYQEQKFQCAGTDGHGGAFCTNSPCHLMFVCHPAN